MENKLIIGNIKMNMKFEDIKNYLNIFKNINSKYIVICPSYIYIPYFLNHNFEVGSQNVCAYEDGGYTGEISALQLFSLGVKYIIVGHSERRIKLNESNIEINNKIKNSIKYNLNVILCIGETLDELNTSRRNIVLKKQIFDCLNGISDLTNIIIAYEPVWAVGTNKLPNIEELEKIIVYIKQTVLEMFNQNVKVIYGGSVNEDNILNLNNIDILDGFLIGSASLNPIKFTQIIKKII